MNDLLTQSASRRTLLCGGILAAAGLVLPGRMRAPADPVVGTGLPPAPAPVAATPATPRTVAGVPRSLIERAMAARDSHDRRLAVRDRMAIVDFDAVSADKRLHLVDVANGRVTRLHVSHGSGSDPGHTGFLQRFSNQEGSNASSEGAFVTDDYYVGKHGRSQRLIGVDPTNDNARMRAIVVHGAWYAEPDMIASLGKLGRSQGCFAVGDSCLQTLFDHLGTGALIYAARA